ncbi:5-hydroxyisourate hydrolase-like [Dryobates pubescens]|uniref:5-hydroxyisourate hydrolase-like n=1 Tax=Dryobates pubescens TaxID=118200 RepID=UPI0023B900C9|nr:5-hydroxyisourate hydrolase-like [Dryobates pubescens]XP_054025849.1 5-hydroxyisourate hydrolase-like [Dryobates pubescens]
MLLPVSRELSPLVLPVAWPGTATLAWLGTAMVTQPGTAVVAGLAPFPFRWTNEDGRCSPLLAPGQVKAGTYKLRFETAAYWQRLGHPSFYPFVEVVFTITDPEQKFHVPLLISPFSYMTYRGS